MKACRPCSSSLFPDLGTYSHSTHRNSTNSSSTSRSPDTYRRPTSAAARHDLRRRSRSRCGLIVSISNRDENRREVAVNIETARSRTSTWRYSAHDDSDTFIVNGTVMARASFLQMHGSPRRVLRSRQGKTKHPSGKARFRRASSLYSGSWLDNRFDAKDPFLPRICTQRVSDRRRK